MTFVSDGSVPLALWDEPGSTDLTVVDCTGAAAELTEERAVLDSTCFRHHPQIEGTVVVLSG